MRDSVPKDESAPLRALLDAISLRDRARASRSLERAPELAREAVLVGASRAEAGVWFFEPIAHYVYAGDTALHVAAAAYAVDIARDLVAKGADVQARNRRGAQPIHYAADGIPGSPGWDPDAQEGIVRLLIEAGADPSSEDKSGVAPLHRAVRTRCAAAVRALLEHGVDPSMKNRSGSTPLHLAVRDTGRGGTGSAAARAEQKAIIRLLVDHGARPSARDSAGRSVIDCARADWIRALLDNR